MSVFYGMVTLENDDAWNIDSIKIKAAKSSKYLYGIQPQA